MKLTVQEAAKVIGAADEAVYGFIDEGSLPAQRIRGQYRINRTDLLEWATSHGFTVQPSVFEHPDSPESATTLTDALRAGGIYHGISGTDLAAVLGSVVGHLPVDDAVDRDTLLQILLAREKLGLAAIGDGIAIPHVRTPLVVASGGSVAVLAFLLDSLPIPTPDAKPVDTLFLLICPNVHAHLAMLAKLAYCLKAPPFRDAVRRRASPDELLRIAAATEAR